MSAGPRPRTRALQLGFVVAGVAAVLLADRTAVAVAAVAGGAPGRFAATLLPIAGRVLGGWAVGMAVRLQLAPVGVPDRQLRLLVGVPAGAICAWPLVAGLLPAGAHAALPAWATSVAVEVAGFVAVVAGLFLAVGVTPRRRRA